jgi:hypothetical protein
MAETLNPMPLVDPVHRFVLFTNAKCGGTTLKAWFFENLGAATLHRHPVTLVRAFGPAYAAAHLRHGRGLARRAARAAPASSDYKEGLRAFVNFYRRAYCAAAMSAGPGADYRRICVTRHPARRLVSAYLDKFCTDEARLPFVADVRRAIGRDDPSFRDFLGYLETVDERDCNPHWRRQTYVLDDQRVDDFVRLEALHAEMTRLADAVGAQRLALLEGRLQATRGAAEGDRPAEAGEDASGLSSAEVAARRGASGRFPPAASFLTPETSERIRRIYAADFARLPYD